MTDTLLAGDALEVLRTLPDASVDMCLTSPPYYALRVSPSRHSGQQKAKKNGMNRSHSARIALKPQRQREDTSQSSMASASPAQNADEPYCRRSPSRRKYRSAQRRGWRIA